MPLEETVMNKIHKLHNQFKHYEWGSAGLIPGFLGIENRKNIPFAEMWMGTHRGAPSMVELNGNMISLTKMTGELPFLLKLLGVENQLSIQVHPNKMQAEEGFAKEEEAHIDLKSPQRCYKDPDHKPEIICALSPFTLMAGFRELTDIQKNLEEFVLMIPQLKEIIAILYDAVKTGSLAALFNNLLNMPLFEREYLSSMILKKDTSKKWEAYKIISQEQWNLMKQFASQYPNDPLILSPIILNLVTLQRGQAVYIPAGILHSYISGIGIELMAASDNVLRCGLTPKYINIPELLNIVDYNPYTLSVITPGASQKFYYRMPDDDFLLVAMSGKGEESAFTEKKPAICFVTEGELLTCGMKFKKGESFFIPADGQDAFFSGNFSFVAAITGINGEEQV